MKPQPNLEVQLWFSEQESLCLSAISIEEIIFGLEAKQAVKKLAWFKRLLHESCEGFYRVQYRYSESF
ncbi:MAG: hypothetical protein QX189_17880 [Methylococcales bacterium]